MTEESEKKRFRGSNYTSEEKLLLLTLVEQCKSVVENKKTDQISWRDKDAAWLDITKQFNATCPNGVLRSSDSLRKYFDNLKKKVRKVAAKEKRERYQTGGGKAPTFDDPTFDYTLSIISEKSVKGLENQFDSDHTYVKPTPSSQLVFEELAVDDIVLDHYCDVSTSTAGLSTANKSTANMNDKEPAVCVDWGNFKPAILQTPLSSKFNISVGNTPDAKEGRPWLKRRRPTAAPKLSNIAEIYSELGSVKLETLRNYKEHLLKTREEAEAEHKLKIELLQLKIELKQAKLDKLKS